MKFPKSLCVTAFFAATILCFIACKNSASPHEHNWGQGVTVQAPTDEDEGLKEYTCSCGQKKTEVLPALNHTHTFSEEWTSDETHHWHKASCGLDKHNADKTEHNWNNGVETTAPTATTEGVKTYTCGTCGKTKTEAIPFLGHEHTINDAVWKQDSAYHWHEASCGIESHHKDKTPHLWNEGVVTTEPTEDTDGEKTFTCKTCGRTKTEAVPAKGHTHSFKTTWMGSDTHHWQEATCGIESHNTPKTLHSWNNGTVAIKPTCTEKGRIVYECTVCGKTKSQELAVAEHTWNEGVVTTPATETEDGSKTLTCTVCGTTKTEVITATGHSHTIATEWSKNATHHWHAASCENEAHNKDKEEHKWNDGITTTAPTCTEAGIATFTCTVCAATKTTPIAAKGHSFDTEWTSDDDKHWLKATCGHDVKSGEKTHNWNSGVVTTEPTDTETGVRTYTCTTCGRTRTEDIPMRTTGDGSYGLQFVSGNIDLSYNQKAKTYSAVIDGAESLTFAWYIDGVQIAGQTSATLLESALPAADVGYHELIVATRKDGTTCSATYSVLMGHIHTIATTWSGDNTYHWHAASCKKPEHHEDIAEHTLVNGTVKKAATCTAPGIRTYVCPVCKMSIEKSDIPALGHAWDAGTVTKAATCKSTGQKKYTCTRCSWTKTETIPVSQTHDWVVTSQIPATIYESGTTYYKCNVCGNTKEEIITKLDHSHTMLTAWTSDNTNHWHEADCGNVGCREDITAHTWVEDATDNDIQLCSVCKRIKETDTNKFTLTFISGSITLSQSGNIVTATPNAALGDVTSFNWYFNGEKLSVTGNTLDLTTLSISEPSRYDLTVTTRKNGVTWSAYYTVNLKN